MPFATVVVAVTTVVVAVTTAFVAVTTAFVAVTTAFVPFATLAVPFATVIVAVARVVVPFATVVMAVATVVVAVATVVVERVIWTWPRAAIARMLGGAGAAGDFPGTWRSAPGGVGARGVISRAAITPVKNFRLCRLSDLKRRPRLAEMKGGDGGSTAHADRVIG
jgi:hypothetical protein